MLRTVLAGGHVLDVRGAAAAPADVVVVGDRIVAVGLGLDGDDQVDCTGRLIVPGFIDCHSHVALTQRLGAPRRFEHPASFHQLSAVPVLATLLANGVTTVRDAWGADAGLREALRMGWFPGPDLLLSVKQLSTTGGIGDRWSAELGELPGPDPALPMSTFDGADQARAAVRRMVRAGADWIKVTATGSVQDEHARETQLTREELATIVDEAALRGCGVMVHAHEARAAAMATEVGARSIEHGVWLDENAVATMAQHGTVLVPTLSVTQGRGGQVGSEVAAAHRVSFQLAVGGGVRIAMGTDNPVTPHSGVLREIELMAVAGLGAAGAFRAATMNGAKLLGLDGDRGEVSAGKRADLVLLNGAEVSTDRLAQRITGVWRNGERVR